MAAWKISISKSQHGDYQLQVKLRGSSYRFNRALPPDFSDLVSPQSCNKPGRKWRRASIGKDDNDLLFCAADLATLKEIGGRLYESLFRVETESGPEDLTNALLESRSEGLDLQIDLTEAPDLGRVPWEALYLTRKKLLLGVDSRINIVRHLESDGDRLPLAVSPPIRILVAVANPDSELKAKAELGNIALRLGSLPHHAKGGYDITTLERATRTELQDRIAGWQPHIIHFIGHGGFHDERGLLYLHSGKDLAKSDAIDSETLRDLVREHPPWLAVLNSCLSGAAAKADPFGGAAQNLIQAGVPFVVAMQASVSDDAAIRFSQRFYEALAQEETVATAVTRGRNGIRTLEDQSLQPELITPVLYSNGKAERIAFAAAEPTAKPASASVVATVLADFKKSGIAALVVATLGVVATIWFAADSPQRSSHPTSARSDSVAAAEGSLTYGNARASGDYASNAVADFAGPAEAGEDATMDVVLTADRESRRVEAVQDALPRRHAPPRRLRPAASPAPAPAPISQMSRRYATAERAYDPAAYRRARRSLAPPRPDEALAGSLLGSAASQAPTYNVAPTERPAAALARIEAYAQAAREVEERLANARERAAERNSLALAPPPAAASPASPETARAAAAGVRRGRRIGGLIGSLLREPRPDEQFRSALPRDRIVRQNSAVGLAVGGPLASDYFVGLPLEAGVAVFDAGSPDPARIDVARYIAALSAPVDPAMVIELVGIAAAEDERTVSGSLGLARAQSVAGALRAGQVADERIVIASAGRYWTPASYEPDLQRAVEARLGLREADRIRFAPGSAEVAADNAGPLDRIAAFARDNPRYWLKLEGHAESSEPAPLNLSRLRIDSVLGELRRRGVDEHRVSMRLYADTHPEVIGQGGSAADRRVQIVLIPPFGASTEPSAPPPDPPTRP